MSLFSSSVWLALLATAGVLHHTTEAFPTLLVNSCDRSLAVGEIIMGVPVQPAENAPDAEQHTILVNDLTTSESICGTTVQQGEEVALVVDPTLVSLVTDPSWTQGGGPNYIVEVTNALIQNPDSLNERGCDESRMVNPDASTTIVPLIPGEMVVRLLSAYQFGQVTASEECTVTVTGNREIVRHTGYLVDNASFQSNSSLATMPYTLTAQQIIDGFESGFSVLEMQEDGTFSIKYSISNTEKVVKFLERLNQDDSDIQVSLIGFETEDDRAVQVASLTRCTSSTSCEGFYTIPTDQPDQVCLTDGLCVASSVVDEEAGTITVTIESNDDSWFGIGFSTPGGGMNAGGAGSDIFLCSQEGLRRFVVTQRANPGNTAASTEVLQQDDPEDELIKNLCVLDTEENTGRMTFTRSLAGGLRPITPGTAQALIFARGPIGEQTLSSQHPTGRRGQVELDLTNLDSGVSVVKLEAEKILWWHIVFMSLSWGLFLPLAVVIASCTRNVTGGRPGAWFQWHKTLARIGWTLQTLGALFGIYYCEVYTDHFQFDHTKLGIFVAMAGFFQPISAVFRPHPPKEGWPEGKTPILRTIFEVYHKGIGWTAVVCGMVNIFLGADLVKDLGFEDITKNVPISLASIGAALFAIIAVACLVAPDNPIAKALTCAKKEASEEPEEPKKAEVEMGE